MKSMGVMDEHTDNLSAFSRMRERVAPIQLPHR